MIAYNYDLNHLHGLDALTKIGDGITISFSDMVDFTGMPSLNYLGGLSIYYTGTTGFTGLEGLMHIHGDLNIINGYYLTSLDGLQNITGINGFLQISLTSIKSLDGISNISPGSINSMHIYMNDSLWDCSFTNICTYLANSLGAINIYDNAPGCVNKEEILENCATGFFENQNIQAPVTFFPNPAREEIFILSQENLFVEELRFYNTSGQRVLITNMITGTIDISGLPPGIYFIEMLADSKTYRNKLIKN